MFAALLVFSVIVMIKKPSHARDWELGQDRTPKIDIKENKVTISDFRDFSWKESGEAIPKYETREFDLEKIETVDVFISHFSDFEGLAHIFLSFGFSDGKHAVFSVETRREKDEEFSPVKGLFREFEIIYVVGSEKDLVGVRTGPRNERIYLYPTIATAEKSKELFLKVAEDVNHVYENPKFYNTLLSNCTNVITRRVEDISDLEFPFTYKTILPGYFDEVMYEMNLIPKKDSFEETKKVFQIDNAKVDRNSMEYEKQIRILSEDIN